MSELLTHINDHFLCLGSPGVNVRPVVSADRLQSVNFPVRFTGHSRKRVRVNGFFFFADKTISNALGIVERSTEDRFVRL